MYLNTILPDYFDSGKASKILTQNGFGPKLVHRVQAFIHFIFTRHRAVMFKYRDEPKVKRDYLSIPRDIRRTLLTQEHYVKLVKLFDGLLYDIKKKNGKPVYAEGSYCMRFKLKPFNQTYTKVLTDHWANTALERVRKKDIIKNGYYKYVVNITDKFCLKSNEESIRSIQDFFDSKTPWMNHYFTPESFIEAFNKNELVYPTTDDYGRRLHTKCSALPKTLRKFLFVKDHKGEELVGLDISNSQPFISSVLTPEFVGNYLTECKSAINIIKRYRYKVDYKLYSIESVKGNIYEFFAELMKKEFNYEVSREEVKKLFMYVLFCNYHGAEKLLETKLKFGPIEKFKRNKNGKEKATDEFKAQGFYVFKKHFPSVYQCNKEIKQLNWRHLCSAKSLFYSQNSLLLQRFESTLFFKIIVPRLLKERHQFFTTIHDSIICFKKDVIKIKQLMADAIRDVGLPSPKISFEEYE